MPPATPGEDAPFIENKPNTGLKTPLQTPWRARQHAEFQALLASLPETINCICEICDCGRCVHSHTCRRATANQRAKTSEPFPITHTHDEFTKKSVPPRSSKRPPPTPRETDIPPMDFTTNQRTDFIPRPVQKMKPVSPPKPNHERPTDPLDGISYYMQEYPAKKLSTPSKVLNAKHADLIKTRSDAKFYGNTTNNDHYKQWRRVHATPAHDPPCLTGELLYPVKDKLPQSTTQQAFPGIYQAKPDQIKAAPDNLTLSGDHAFLTTMQDVYKGTHGPRADKFVPMPKPIVQKGPLMSESQTKADYPKKSIERVKPVDPLQPRIDLKFDNGRSFDTEQRFIYKGHDAAKHPVPKSFKKTPVNYERPAVPMDGLTVTHAVYTPKNIADSYVPLKQAPTDHLTRDLPKFDDRTAHKDQFKNWGNRRQYRFTHADFAEAYNRPEGEFYGKSTTKDTYSTPLVPGLQASCKPEPKPIASEGEFDFSTVNSKTYNGQIIKPCRAKLWIMQQKLKENFNRSLQNTAATLHHLEGILNCIDTMESILCVHDEGSNQHAGEMLESQQVERVTTEFNQLQFYVSQCRNIPLVDNCRARINRITQVLQKNLERMFIEGIQSNDQDLISRSLRTYVTIDKVCDAEALFAREVVYPYMCEFINEDYLKSQVTTEEMYMKILEFKQLHCTTLLNILKSNDSQGSLRSYNFLVNSVWKQVVELMETQTVSVFAAGNPDKFYKEYNMAMKFVQDYESQLENPQSVLKLRESESFKHFMSKWSLPIYFQIRFHEIAGSVEKALMSPWMKSADQQTFCLQLSHSVLEAIKNCWKDGVYLQALCHRFWKLTLQILSRYEHWLIDIVNGKVKVEEEKQVPAKTRVSSLKQDGRSSPGSGRNSPAVGGGSPQLITEERSLNVEELVYVLKDAYKLQSLVTAALEEWPIMTSPLVSSEVRVSLRGAAAESFDRINTQLLSIEHMICDIVINTVASPLNQVRDVPRLYRKTNKEVPSKPSSYIQTSIQSIETFQSAELTGLPSDIKNRILHHIVGNTTKQYENWTSEVLVSVKKMEDSLKRLKRGKTSTGSGPRNVSDDDKIRIQISLDVKQYKAQLIALGVDLDSIESVQKLQDVVDQSLPEKDNS